MIRFHYAMKKDLLDKYADTKTSIIEARNAMSAEQIASAKVEILKECSINDVLVNEDGTTSVEYSVVDGVARIPIMGMLTQEVN
ncbi:MAG: hypothetical protein EOM15_10795, partial [Spirochaetia bacterium]|nr:hypothetical protein [Spirochaetia bacterium]